MANERKPDVRQRSSCICLIALFTAVAAYILFSPIVIVLSCKKITFTSLTHGQSKRSDRHLANAAEYRRELNQVPQHITCGKCVMRAFFFFYYCIVCTSHLSHRTVSNKRLGSCLILVYSST